MIHGTPEASAAAMTAIPTMTQKKCFPDAVPDLREHRRQILRLFAGTIG